MKIVILGSAYPYRGGLASYNERLAKEFIEQGHEVEIETFKLQYPSFLFPGKTQYTDSPSPEGLNISRSVNSISPFNWIKLGRKIKKSKPDLLIIKYWLPFMAPCFGTIARIARSNKSTQVITIIDNIIPHEKRIGDFTLSKYYVNSSDGFVAMSESVLDDLSEFNQTKPRALCPHPIFDNFGKQIERNEAARLLNLDLKYRYILFFGFIREYKGLDTLIKAFAQDRFRQLPLKLIVAGEFYTDSKPYFDLIKKYGLEKEILLHTHFISDDEVSRYFGICDVIVQPYKTATQSGVTQIGYHFEKPMIVTNVGGIGEIIPDGKVGYVAEPNSEGVANAMFNFFNLNQKDNFEQGIIEEKKKYSWGRMYQTILKIKSQIAQ